MSVVGGQEMDTTLRNMGQGGGAGSGNPISDPFQMGGLLGTLLGAGLGMAAGGQHSYSNQTPVLSSNQACTTPSFVYQESKDKA